MGEYLLLGATLLAVARIWYAIPLIVAISLVYGATRHEHIPQIVSYSLRASLWVTMFIAIIMAVVWVGGWGVV